MNEKIKQKGLFIVLYGVNGVGKTTQAKKLLEKINEAELLVEYIKFPYYDLLPTGQRINNYLREGNPEKLTAEQFQELCAENRRDAEQMIKERLSEGYVVIAEDWTYGGIVWGIATGLTELRAREINKDFLKEDIAILFSGKSFAQGKEEVHKHEENDELLNDVSAQYLLMADKEEWSVVEANQREEEVQRDIWNIVSPKLSQL